MIAQLGPYAIRNLNPWEGAALFKITGDPRVTKYMGFRTHKTEADAAQTLARYADSSAKWFAVCDAKNPVDVLGVFGLEVQGHQAALTIMFRQDWKARGAGRAVSVPLVRWILSQPQTWRVWAFCHVDNVPVRRVLERMGAVHEGRLRRFEFFPNISEEPQDCYVYSVVRG